MGILASEAAVVERRRFLKLAGLGVSIPAIASLTGCGSGEGALGGGGGGGSDVTELIVPTNQSPWLDAYRAVADQYEEETGVRITLRVFPYDGLRPQMTNAIQNNSQVFDVLQLDGPWTAQFYDNEWATPFDQIDSDFSIDSQVLSLDDLSYWDAQKRVSDSSGRVIALPLQANPHLLYYRKDLYDELGLSVPRTWEEAIANGERAVQEGAATYGYVTRGQGSPTGQSITFDYMPVFYSYGASWFVEEGVDWTPAVNSPESIAGTDAYKRLLALGPSDTRSVGQAEVIANLQNGQALQGHAVVAAAPQLLDTSKSEVADSIGYAVVPAGASGSPAPTCGAWSLCIPSGLPDKRAEAAYQYITWLMEKQQQAEFVQAGGAATRKDVLAEHGQEGEGKEYLQTVAASQPNLHHAVRYVFSAPMLEVAEPLLSEICAGEVELEAGLGQLQEDLTRVVRDAGFLA